MQPNIEVGVLFAPEFSFQLEGPFRLRASGEIYEGKGHASCHNGELRILINNRNISAEWNLLITKRAVSN
ncbi:MAG: hypothetical protein PWQ06_1267 [Anaerophaga sp.]|nr:hypothetical protein [Anaerophaga sp.]